MAGFEIVAKTYFGLEEVLAAEIKALGGQDVTCLRRAVSYRGDLALLYRSNLRLRTALRILQPMARFSAASEQQLYDRVRQVDWRPYLDPSQTFAIDATTSGDRFRHSKFVALKTKDAIVDQFRDRTGRRPSVDTVDPDFRLNVHIRDTTCTLSLDSSGLPLSKRGYRLAQTLAPLGEALAAGIILLSGWAGDTDVVDPMCGSGTFSVEAAWIAQNIAPGHLRSFGFERWPNFEAARWAAEQAQARAAERPYHGRIYASDLDLRAIDIARQNIARAGVDEIVRLSRRDFLGSQARSTRGIVFLNPPYGERLAQEEIAAFYRQIGDTLKQGYAGHEAWILSSSQPALKAVGLRAARKLPLYNGPLACQLRQYALFTGRQADQEEAE